MPQGVISIQPLKVRILHQLLEQPVSFVAAALFNRPLAFSLPALVAPRVIELIEDGWISHLETLSEKFGTDTGILQGVVEPAMSLQSQIACTGCHAQ